MIAISDSLRDAPPPGEAGEVHTIRQSLYRTALREREDDILPYRGWGILASTIQPDASKCYCFLAQNVTGWAGAGAGFVPSKGRF